jgi:hypothetical protein
MARPGGRPAFLLPPLVDARQEAYDRAGVDADDSPALVDRLPGVVARAVGVRGGAFITAPPQDKPKPVTFTADIAPLLAAKCQPCHFEGGKVFDKLPFDQYKTVAKIAPRLHTRLKGQDEHLVARWIEQGTPE